MTPAYPRLLFASYHCLLDPASGAAVEVRELLEALAVRNVPVLAFCGARLDRLGVRIASWLDHQGIRKSEQHLDFFHDVVNPKT